MSNSISITYNKNSDLHDCEMKLTPTMQTAMMQYIKAVFDLELITGEISILGGNVFIRFQSTEDKLKELQRLVAQSMFIDNVNPH